MDTADDMHLSIIALLNAVVALVEVHPEAAERAANALYQLVEKEPRHRRTMRRSMMALFLSTASKPPYTNGD